jgi:DNA (cytosine-5)-methyltransferase 1
MAALPTIRHNGLKVFSCFHCGGGSTMGYKLAGYQVLGGVEIDPDMMKLYRANHHPQHSYLMPVQDFTAMPSLPRELYELDILDGSPPCSAFSTAGARQKKWGIETYFREGQQRQRLDDLFFHFIDIADKLKPRVVVAENVRGLIIGKAKGYVSEIFDAFRQAGYQTQLFLLNASRMGVPQSRERTFFIARRDGEPIQLEYKETPTTAGEALHGATQETERPASAGVMKYLTRTPAGGCLADAHPKGNLFNFVRLHPDRPAPTLTATCTLYHQTENRKITQAEAMRLQTFPDDYNRLDQDMRYVCGMSVPPFMMQRVALEIGRQLFGIDYDHTRRTLA